MNNTGNVHNHALTQQKKEDLAGLMEAWGQGKLREYLAPDLAKIDAAAAKGVEPKEAPSVETETKTKEPEDKATKGIFGYFWVGSGQA